MADTPIVGARAGGDIRRDMFVEENFIWAGRNDHPAVNSGATDELPVTPAAYRALEQERESLRREKSQFAEQLRFVREFGDTANNDEYHAVREEEALLDARVARLEDILSRATIVDAAHTDGTIAIGSVVTVLDLGAREPFDYVIDSAHAPVAPNAVSAVSPVGKALLGRRPGDVVTVQLPKKGRTRELEILAAQPLESP
jgi:transcription elongation factor GreA